MRFWPFNGNSIIFDQNMGRPWQWKKLKEVCDLVPRARLVTFIFDCPYEICVERFNNRTEHPDLGDVDIYAHKFKWNYLNDNIFPDAIRIDATQPQRKVLSDVLAHLSPLFTEI